jgi:hypothetical protein
MAQVPLTACALVAGLPADCVRPASEQHCNQMDRMSPPQNIKAASGRSCCQVAQAPVPEAQNKIAAPEAGANVILAESFAVPPAQPVESADPANTTVVSPPHLQSLLCVFLI